MSSLESIILGILQGITEFLPISSSAHLYLFPHFAGKTYQGLAFDVMLHLGSSLAILLYFLKDWIKFVKGGLGEPKTENGRFFWLLATATVPAAAAGLTLENAAENIFRNPVWISVNLCVFALLLLAADTKRPERKKTMSLNLRDALIIGMAQCLALMPGVSRSGITITAALFLGYGKSDSAKISFYLALPIILGAGVLESFKLTSADINSGLFFGFFFSFASALLAIKFLLSYLEKKNFLVFVIYRIGLGAAILLTL